MADGQVTRGNEIVKPNVKKVRRLNDAVIGGFAGAAHALALNVLALFCLMLSDANCILQCTILNATLHICKVICVRKTLA